MQLFSSRHSLNKFGSAPGLPKRRTVPAVYIQDAKREKNMSLELICKIGNTLGIEIINGLI